MDFVKKKEERRMKFIISRQELSELVNRLQNVVAPKTPIPILSNFLIEVQDSRIVLTATDLTVGVRCTGSAKVIEAGATTLPAKRFAQLLRELTASHLEISTDDKDITHIVADSSTFKLHGLSKNEFPHLPDFNEAAKLHFKQSELKDMLFRTAFAVSKEDNRYVLTGVYLQFVNGVALFVGTDGKRLARAYVPVQTDSDANIECIIPLKAIEEIVKSLRDDEEMAILYIMPDKIAVEAGETVIVTKLLSGDYPDVDRVIPLESQGVVSLHREELMSLLRQISLFTNEATHSVRLTLSGSELNLTANTIDIGEGKVSMPVHYGGPRFDIAFNPSSLLHILQHSHKETISFGFTDSYNPIVIADGELQPSHKEFPSPLFVLMPMRLSE